MEGHVKVGRGVVRILFQVTHFTMFQSPEQALVVVRDGKGSRKYRPATRK